MSDVADRLLDALRLEGHRITMARRAICEVIADSRNAHLDAAAIHDLVAKQTGTAVNQSTVYRTLDALERAGLIEHTHFGHRAAVYHLANDTPHRHLVCEDCGATVAVAARDLEAWSAAVRERTGFVVEASHFALTGRCADCAARREASNGAPERLEPGT